MRDSVLVEFCRGRALFALLPAVMLWGCTALPEQRPDGKRAGPSSPAATVQMSGVSGPLTPAQSKAIIEALQRRSPETDIFQRHLALEEAIVGSPLTTGNAVTLLQDGPATYRAMLEAIAASRDHIHLQTYILDDDEVGQRFASALLDRRKAGVQVALIRDSVGTLGTPAAFFERLEAGGVQVLEFNPVNPLTAGPGWPLNQRGHRKLLIVDGHTAFLGGINISGVYSGGSFKSSSRVPRAADSSPVVAWRDTDLRLQGPVVAELQKLFLESWAQQQGPPLTPREAFPPPMAAGSEVVRAIGSSPDERYSLIYATLLSAIGSAETSVHITNAYFAPDPQLLAALKAAVARGVEVTLILPSQTDSWLVFHAGRGYYDELLCAGVRIHERNGVVLHSKTVLVDGVWATVGSTNLDWRSFLHNHELNAVVLGPDFGRQVRAMFEQDLAASTAVTLESWRRRGLVLRLHEWFARLWEYWL
ncbi:MAG: phospholipase D-like domain-containing protein [Rubrivivax sp.]|jgi:cardiolipin synthase